MSCCNFIFLKKKYTFCYNFCMQVFITVIPNLVKNGITQKNVLSLYLGLCMYTHEKIFKKMVCTNNDSQTTKARA